MLYNNILITRLEDLSHLFKRYDFHNSISGDQEIFIELKREYLSCPYCGYKINTIINVKLRMDKSVVYVNLLLTP